MGVIGNQPWLDSGSHRGLPGNIPDSSQGETVAIAFWMIIYFRGP